MCPEVVLSHAQKIRILYKSILRLHRGLPAELKTLGDQYVKEEFRHHKVASEPHIKAFMNEWTNYAIMMTQQVGLKKSSSEKNIGINLSEQFLETLSDEQAVQLYELYKEASRASDDESQKFT